ncbi:MAG TPA: ATP-binding protein [Leptolinea sp.]
MEINTTTFFGLLSSLPGNLVYYLILVYSITASLLTVVTGYRAANFPRPTRILVGLSILLVATILPVIYLVILLVSAAIPPVIYPLLERTSLTWLMIWSAWLWLSFRPSKFVDITAIAFSIVLPAVTGIMAFIFQDTASAFNASPADIVWHFMAIAITLLFVIIIIRRKPAIWSYGIGMMIIILAGFIISLAVMNPFGDISGAARLGILCAFPLLSILARRQDMVIPQSQTEFSFSSVMNQAAAHPVPDEINFWLAAAGNPDIVRQQEAVARILCQSLDATSCVFLQLSEIPGMIRLTSGYDFKNQTWLEPKDVSSEEIPKTAASLLNATLSILRNNAENKLDINKFSNWLKTADISSIAILPIKNTNSQWGAAVLCRTADLPSFIMETLQQFSKTASSLSHIFQNSETAEKEKRDLIRLAKDLEALLAANQNLKENLESLRLSAVQVKPEPDILQLLTLQQASQTEIDRLRGENQLLLQTISDENQDRLPGEKNDQTNLEKKLVAARADINRLEDLLHDSKRRVKELEKRTNITATSAESLRKFNSLITQIRHPLSAITGYVELLLSDHDSNQSLPADSSTLENLQSSLSRLRIIMDELANINILNSGVIDLEPELMDLNNAIDQAVSAISFTYMQKEISLKLDLPAVLPSINTYHEALQKVILNLLQNAGKATPQNGSVEFRVEVHEESSEPYLLIEVTDLGGGIAPEDFPQIFTPVDNLQSKVIPGLGDVNGGLATSRTLVEAHGGRIWVDSNPGISTTFSILLPFQTIKKNEVRPLE